MANDFLAYTVIHQPRRVKLPSQPIPAGASAAEIARALFDEPMNRRYFTQVMEKCYIPATQAFIELADGGFKLSLGMSVSFLLQAEEWEPELYQLIHKLATHPNVELIGVEPYHSFLFYLDIRRFVERMEWMREEMFRRFGKRPTVTDTTEMFMSNDIYFALKQAGFQGAVMDGREWVMAGREPTRLYQFRETPYLLCRHYRLSDDVGYRYSDRNWEGYPLKAHTYADWIAKANGSFVMVGWDYETFGEHHREDTEIFEFLKQLPQQLKQRGVEFLLPSKAIARYGGEAGHLPVPDYPTTWAGTGGVEFFLSNTAQQAIFQLMHHAYNKAVLTGDPEIIDLALWLLQSDNLHLIQWFGRMGSEAEVSAYFTPQEWWQLGPVGIITELQNVYKNFIRALDSHM